MPICFVFKRHDREKFNLKSRIRNQSDTIEKLNSVVRCLLFLFLFFVVFLFCFFVRFLSGQGKNESLNLVSSN